MACISSASVSIIWNGTCKVEFIQSLVGFILCQFACNSAFRNPVFMWESCKDSVKEAQECEESSRVCTQ